MKGLVRYSLIMVAAALTCTAAFAQPDRREVRSGNRQFKKGNWQKSEIEYRKALVKDTSSVAASYNLANALYRQENFEEAGKSLEKVKEGASVSPSAADYFYNLGNVAVKKEDWSGAVEAYKQSLLRRPDDMDAKENYAYAKLMLKNQGGGGGGNNDQSQDQNQQDQNQDQDQDQDQNQDQNQNQNQDQQGQGQGDAKISPQQAQQMLKAIQAREKETQDKVNKEKAAVLKSRQKDKNW
ncbi:MAG: tetratricopeptide repeat protein [Bacteroidales bacterium]|nr:tetratricopeptide repeat protein [Bacteroidales bacterium]